jgi:hypothetical protein
MIDMGEEIEKADALFKDGWGYIRFGASDVTLDGRYSTAQLRAILAERERLDVLAKDHWYCLDCGESGTGTHAG